LGPAPECVDVIGLTVAGVIVIERIPAWPAGEAVRGSAAVQAVVAAKAVEVVASLVALDVVAPTGADQ
jgi:hypothetical protein